MDAKARPEKSIDEAIKTLKIDPTSKASSMTMSGPKASSLSDATSYISTGDATSSIKESEVYQDVSVDDQGMYYYGYYYPGSHGAMGDWDNSCCNHGTDNVQAEYPTIQADNGSMVYYFPGFQTGYSNYGSFSPGPYGVDGQFWGQGSYYPSPVSPQTAVSPGIFPHPIAYGPELIPAYQWDPYFFFQDEIQGSTFTLDPTNPHYKRNHSSHGYNFPPAKTSTTSKVASLASDLSYSVSTQNQTQKSVKKAPAAALSKGFVPVNKFSSYANQTKGALLYPNSAIPVKEKNYSLVDEEKLKARNKLNSLADLDLLNEQNRGPRTNSGKTTSHSGNNLQEILNIEKNDNNSGSIALTNSNEYNSPDFITEYEKALFFVIKSYSEDDVHKSIKYNVWASTPNGNKRLDNAFQAAQEKNVEKGGKCPVFLFFSVNASGQFCGVAEMTGRVDFSKNMDFWQQDKWNGFFPVKWHIIKDVPNPQLRHIILENNENKPVTNSRDTQEIKFPQGTEMLNIFKSYCAKTSILDDFGFYENRQKAMQEKRNKPGSPSLDNSLAQTVESTQFQRLVDSNAKLHKLVPIEAKEALPCSMVTSPK
ncbi:YTH domain-containing protein ECT4-like isoform X1 [Zingiber officinale]|uniref:YTH domain-containing protein ECT4-like isoform X1 n=2 Tax=Zingiber officinale TaxID=94328 RepID=UPI001C4B9BF2|nr:YTH domain-containing protein ECT4-like isoform X1 [Zingiber officinale]